VYVSFLLKGYMASNIVIADAAGTPVNHTFVPMGLDKDGIYWWVDQSATNALGYWRISAITKRPKPGVSGTSSSGRTFRVEVGLHEPVLANITNSTVSGVAPAPTLAYTPRSLHTFILPEEGDSLSRDNLAKMSPLLLSDPQIAALVKTLAYPGF
jgi:hypothetical protein